MKRINIEIKAVCTDPDYIETYLHRMQAEFKGEDHQVDTYFKASSGRLKLREGRIENALIRYHRPEKKGLKRSDVFLYRITGETGHLRIILEDTLGIDIVVEKRRKIYYIGNVKFHIDHVHRLGCFVEIEAIDANGHLEEHALKRQCRHYMTELGISEADLVAASYSDLIRHRGT
jgi:predicted adenylyl cyclase CyaB